MAPGGAENAPRTVMWALTSHCTSRAARPGRAPRGRGRPAHVRAHECTWKCRAVGPDVHFWVTVPCTTRYPRSRPHGAPIVTTAQCALVHGRALTYALVRGQFQRMCCARACVALTWCHTPPGHAAPAPPDSLPGGVHPDHTEGREGNDG